MANNIINTFAQEMSGVKQNSTAYSSRLSKEWESAYLERENELKEKSSLSPNTEQKKSNMPEHENKEAKGVLGQYATLAKTVDNREGKNQTSPGSRSLGSALERQSISVTVSKDSGRLNLSISTQAGQFNAKAELNTQKDVNKSQASSNQRLFDTRPLSKHGIHMVSGPDGSVSIWLRDASLNRDQGTLIVQQLASMLKKSGFKLSSFTLNSEEIYSSNNIDTVQNAKHDSLQLFEYY